MMLKKQKKNIISELLIYLLLGGISVLRSIATYSFIVPNAFAPGGIGGIASIIYNIVAIYNLNLADTVFNPAVIVLVLNIPLLIAAFLLLNKQFVLRTIYCVFLYAGFMGLFSIVKFPIFQGTGIESGVVILASLAGGVLSGISLGINLLTNSSAGGTDIIARLTSRKIPQFNVNWLIFLFDSVVVLFSGIVGFLKQDVTTDGNKILLNVMTPILYSFITLFLTSQVADFISNGTQSSVVFNIITNKYQDMGQAIICELKRGATVLKGQGMYTNGERIMLICVVKRRQSPELKRLVKRVDPEAFMYVTKAAEVNGFGFHVATEIPVKINQNKLK